MGPRPGAPLAARRARVARFPGSQFSGPAGSAPGASNGPVSDSPMVDAVGSGNDAKTTLQINEL
jgi:hypothetical protein